MWPRRDAGREPRGLCAPSGSVDDPEGYVAGALPSGAEGRGYAPYPAGRKQEGLHQGS